MRAVTIGLLVYALVAMPGCAFEAESTDPRAVTIMTFNVENLFDTRDDAGKNDATFLPLADKRTESHRAGCAGIEVARWREQCISLDWSEAVLEQKLTALAAAILANGPDARGPDIVVLQEVENRRVVEQLRQDHLAGAGYRPAVLIEGRDVRGIDVAFLSRLPLIGSPVLHDVELDGVSEAVRGDTRGVLEATFRLPDGTALTGFAVHFPAPFHPVELRVKTYEALAELLRALPSGRPAFAAGDFNTISSEAWVLDRHVAADWRIAHRIACDGCRGTYYYAPDDNWSFLDMILLSPSLAQSTWQLEPTQTRVATASAAQISPRGTPNRFDPVRGEGVSDHWPLRITLVPTSP